jgi:hypothetical protein
MEDDFLEKYKAEIHRIGHKHPEPCKEMVKEVVDFIYPKCEKFSGEYNPAERWKQGVFILSLMDEYYMNNPIHFVDIWKKYAFDMAKENNQYCSIDFEVSKHGK